MIRFQTVFIGLLLTFASTLCFAWGLKHNNPYIMVFPVLMYAGVFALAKPHLIFLTGIALWHSSLVLPGFPNQLQLYHVFLLIAALVSMVRMTITKEKYEGDRFLGFIVGMYGVVAFYTMLARGVGFSVIGSDQIGGMRYVMIFVAVLGIWFLPNIEVSRKLLQTSLYAYVLLGFLPVLAEFIFIVSKGAIYQQYSFVKVGQLLGNNYFSALANEGVRYTSTAALGRGIAMIPFLFFPFKRKYFLHYGVFVAGSLLTLAFSGYRTQIALMILTFFISFLILLRYRRKEFTLFCVVGGLLVYIIILVSFDSLPFGFQRAVSFLPGIDSYATAVVDASASTGFRFNLWEMGIREIPNYLWLGRGLTYNYSEFLALEVYGLEGKELDLGVLSNLHNGPLEVLVYFGIPGILLFSVFSFRLVQVMCRKIQTRNRESNNDPLFIYLSAYMFVSLFLWWLSFGNAYNSLLQLIIMYLIVSKLHRSGLQEEEMLINSQNTLSETVHAH